MLMKQWLFPDDLAQLDLGESGAKPGQWRGQDALYFEAFLTNPVLVRNYTPPDCFRLRAEVAIPGPNGFLGLVFGVRDAQNYELIYISAASASSIGDIQYDPVMNGSTTWQIYNGPGYQAQAPVPPGEWVALTLEVRKDTAAICVGDNAVPQLIVSKLQHGPAVGSIGMWANLPGYIRSMTIEQIQPEHTEQQEQRPPQCNRLPADSMLLTEWQLSEPYASDGPTGPLQFPTKVVAEENGTVNLNRLHPTSEKGTALQAECTLLLPEERESMLSFGFSDRMRLWVNGMEVYQGDWKWGPPASDGRIRPDHAAVPVRWRAGRNSIRAEITNLEGKFGWGFCVKAHLSNAEYRN
ncbi:hypothetical protein ACFQI7_02485 [Paenibacillus allorhizosphaerae]|uniref:DUF1080 domain-containing protein n=1 Tax=Paenibacillus allorhizosphaerae TaxID=2849866 RepID=A0ABN7TBK4_9BACL|nr:hypothetical protein [Paenibacillus allorhizosphaerae]CAG7617850.1 hypothetical protein PAECIP111802_00458 [Paenibacillus allorhizosphaerae]